ncbi:MAG TPA: serine/threonine protein kinase, partial [Nannocystis exedens]|nr:serine/threonine protein kinase [Nannocystis exedens]
EAKRLARPQHPNVVVVHDYNAARLQPGDIRCFYVAMELLDGHSLRRWLSTRPPPDKIIEVFCRAGEGLYAAHRVGLVHRDFKPENVVLVDGTPKIVDFGLATDEPLATTRLSTADPDERMIVGTLAYMAPEALEGRADARSDQFAFAASLWEALYGEFPYPIESIDPADRRKIEPRRGGDTYPDALRRCLVRALSSSPNRRFSDMQQVVARLRELQPSLAGVVSQASAPRIEVEDLTSQSHDEQRRPSRKWTIVPLLALAATGAVAFVGTGGLDRWLSPQRGQASAMNTMNSMNPVAGAQNAPTQKLTVVPCERERGWLGTWRFTTTPLWEVPDRSGVTGEYTIEITQHEPTSTCELALKLIKTGVVSSKGRKTIDHRTEFVASLSQLGNREALVLTNIKPHEGEKDALFVYDFALLRDGDDLIGDFYEMRPGGAQRFSGALSGRRDDGTANKRGQRHCDPSLAQKLAGDWRFIAKDEHKHSNLRQAEYVLSLAPSICSFTVKHEGTELGSGVAYERELWRVRIDDGRLRREWTLTGANTPLGRFQTLRGGDEAPVAEGTLSARRP